MTEVHEGHQTTRHLPDRRAEREQRDVWVRRILELHDDAIVTDALTQQTVATYRRRVVKAKQGMDYRTMLAHFHERAAAGRLKCEPASA